MIEEKYQDVAKALAADSDELLRAAILRHTGQGDVVAADIKRFGVMKQLPDRSQIFAYDGVDLVRIWPVEVTTGLEGLRVMLRATRRYQVIQ